MKYLLFSRRRLAMRAPLVMAQPPPGLSIPTAAKSPLLSEHLSTFPVLFRGGALWLGAKNLRAKG
jgi:hypothetical protein